jgi:histidyl-tRNA synthetase
VYVTLFSAETAAASLNLARELRDAGVPVVTALQPDKLGKQFKEADQKGMRWALVIGPDELSRGEVVVKDLRSGEQRSLPRDEAIAAVR